LCVTQITGWGVVYYAFPVLNPAITRATGWPAGATTAAFSLGLVVSALAGIRVGRILDRRGPRTRMTAGSALGTARRPRRTRRRPPQGPTRRNPGQSAGEEGLDPELRPTYPTSGRPGPASARGGKLRLPALRMTTATASGAYPFLAEGGLGAEGILRVARPCSA
jgi:hypothetical protein